MQVGYSFSGGHSGKDGHDGCSAFALKGNVRQAFGVCLGEVN
jgi:hypothetical protein